MARQSKQQKQQKKQKQQQQQQQQGGEAGSAAAFGQQVYGTNQHAQAGTNLIEAKHVSNCGAMTGGKRKNKGGNVITDIAVPAVLLTANQLYVRRKTSKFARKSRKGFRKSRRSTYRKRR